VGGDQEDVFYADAGADKISGAGGVTDRVTFELSTSGVLINLDNLASNTGDAKGDTYSDIEAYDLTAFNDTFYTLVGGLDIHAGAGNDTVEASGMQNHISGEAGNDKLTGGNSGDWLYGGDDSDSLFGKGGADHLYGGNGVDKLDGGDGDDTIYGGEGGDTLTGGLGEDTLWGDDDNDNLSGGAQNDTLNGGAGEDVLSGGADNDVLNGDTGNDTLKGDEGDDTLGGGDGNDTLLGGDGDDRLEASVGIDKMTGGGGIDEFVLFHGLTDGVDQITDFKLGEDKLVLADIFDGAGGKIDDLLDAGIHAGSSGNVLTIYQNDVALAQITGWTGPQITSTQDLVLTMGNSLILEQ
jgi:Ca2+-binding RTX toxin-like protein